MKFFPLSLISASNILFTSLLSILLLPLPEGFAEEEERTSLFGDFGGNRTCLEDMGITFESVLTYDFMRNVKGGIKTGGTGLANHNFTAEFDLEKMKLVNGGKFFFYYLSNWGNAMSGNYIGDFQVASNIETFSTSKLYEAWYEQTFMDGAFSVLGGMHDYNSEFDVLNYGIHLMNSSFGMGPDVAQIPPSNFPSTTLGLRLRVQPTENTYGLLGFYDGVPGDPDHPAGTRVKIGGDDGLMTAYEVGYLVDSEVDYKKFSVGGWFNTAHYEDYTGEIRNSNKGLYLLAEGKIYDEGNEDAQGLGLFSALGFADGTRNQTQFYAGGGFMYQGAIPERDSDVITAGIAYARNSNTFVQANDSDRGETAIEVMYKYFITPYLDVAPDFQYIINPGMDKNLDDAYVVSMRVEVAM